jgi:hypothetical protein
LEPVSCATRTRPWKANNRMNRKAFLMILLVYR